MILVGCRGEELAEDGIEPIKQVRPQEAISTGQINSVSKGTFLDFLWGKIVAMTDDRVPHIVTYLRNKPLVVFDEQYSIFGRLHD